MPTCAWRRRERARALVKLLAVTSGHRLHREQIVDLLWPDVDMDSALNSFAKALHAARRALEPDLPARQESAYLHLTDGVLSLDTASITIDADEFESLAETALATTDPELCERALAAYSGELLPEDRYEEWAERPRRALSELYQSVLVLAGRHAERQQRHGAALARLRQVLELAPEYEEVHRDVMRLLALSGNRNGAIRQYRLLVKRLEVELGERPSAETEELYRAIVDGEIAPETGALEMEIVQHDQALPFAVQQLRCESLVGRRDLLDTIACRLEEATAGRGSLVLIQGEIGAGKTRLAAEVAAKGRVLGASALWGWQCAQPSAPPFSHFMEALDGYVRERPLDTRNDLASRYPGLTQLIPSLAPADRQAGEPRVYATTHYLQVEIARFLAEIATTAPLLLVFDDIHTMSLEGIHLLQHLAQVASQRRWLIVGTGPTPHATRQSRVQTALDSLVRRGLVQRVVVERLSAESSVAMMEQLLPGGVIDEAAARRLFELSLGNPFALRELIETLRAGGRLRLSGRKWVLADPESAIVSPRIRAVVGHALAELSPSARRLIEVAAVIGTEVPGDLLRAASGMHVQQLMDALDETIEAEFLQERGSRYAFTHPLMREAAREAVSGLRRAYVLGRVRKATEGQRSAAAPLLGQYSQPDNQGMAIVPVRATTNKMTKGRTRERGKRRSRPGRWSR